MKKQKKVTKNQLKTSKLDSSSRISSKLQEEPKKNLKNYTKNIEIQFDQFEQLIEDVNIEQCIIPGSRGLSIKRLVSLLQQRYHIFSKDKLVKFYLHQGNIFLTIPSAKKSFAMFEIQQDDYFHFDTLRLQMFKQKELIDVVMDDSEEESEENLAEDEDDMENDEKVMEGKCRRLKERKIKHVIEKVLKWRQLYAPQNGNEGERLSLEEGAKLVKISKKTLDDYLSQLKKGKKYGFNFNDHRNEKIGVLREFIRKMQKKR